MEGIFISYRRDDSAGYAGRLYDRLVAHFGAESVFMDVEGIEPGTDFVKAIEGAVASCKVLIVLIGNEWLGAADASGRRRLDDPHDFIRLETSTALERDIRVVPVLVDRAAMPLQQDLPKDLQALVRRQAVELNHKQWDASSGELIKTLEKILNTAGASAAVAARPGQTADSSPNYKPGKVLSIAAATLVAIAAGAAFWKFSPIDERRTPPAGTPLTEKVTPSVPAPPKIAEQPFKPIEQETRTAPQPDPIGPAPKETPEVVTASVTPENTGPEAPVPIPLHPPKAPDPSPTPVNPPKAADTAPILTTPPKEAAANRVPVKPVEAKPALPPVISSLTTEMSDTGVSVCYRVEHARKLRLTPIPGDLQNNRSDCVSVSPEKTTSFTLSATGPGGNASRRITVSPHPDKLAEIEQRGKLPGKGESWVYRTRGKWPTSPQWKFKISINRADNGVVSETMTVLEPTTKSARSRSSNGANAGFISWPDIGLEFSPWMGAYSELSGKESWRDFATPDMGSWDRWNSSASTGERERVKVPAGSFDAWRVETWSNRSATGGPAMAGLEPVRMQFLVWYAPEAKRYVKSMRKIIAADGQVLEEDFFELVERRTN